MPRSQVFFTTAENDLSLDPDPCKLLHLCFRKHKVVGKPIIKYVPDNVEIIESPFRGHLDQILLVVNFKFKRCKNSIQGSKKPPIASRTLSNIQLGHKLPFQSSGIIRT